MSATVTSNVDVSLYDVVTVRRPPDWEPHDTHETPPTVDVLGVALYGVDEIVAEDLLCEINSSQWLEEWAVMLPNRAGEGGAA